MTGHSGEIVEVKCSDCDTEFTVPATMAGGKPNCPNCRRVVDVPEKKAGLLEEMVGGIVLIALGGAEGEDLGRGLAVFAGGFGDGAQDLPGPLAEAGFVAVGELAGDESPAALQTTRQRHVDFPVDLLRRQEKTARDPQRDGENQLSMESPIRLNTAIRVLIMNTAAGLQRCQAHSDCAVPWQCFRRLASLRCGVQSSLRRFGHTTAERPKTRGGFEPPRNTICRFQVLRKAMVRLSAAESSWGRTRRRPGTGRPIGISSAIIRRQVDVSRDDPVGFSGG